VLGGGGGGGGARLQERHRSLATTAQKMARFSIAALRIRRWKIALRRTSRFVVSVPFRRIVMSYPVHSKIRTRYEGCHGSQMNLARCLRNDLLYLAIGGDPLGQRVSVPSQYRSPLLDGSSRPVCQLSPYPQTHRCCYFASAAIHFLLAPRIRL